MEFGQINLKCMAILDKANTETYGTPVPTTVPLTVEPGPFIVVTGHDLHDLNQLLEQTDGKGVNIYTHGEMLPCHAYPELKKHPQLKVTSVLHGKINKKNSLTFLAHSCSLQTALCHQKKTTELISSLQIW